MKFFTITRQRLTSLLYYIFCVSLFISASACTNSNHSPSDTGSVSFSVEWRGAPTKQPYETRFRALDCGAAGVASVEAEIYDENNFYLTAGGPWLCSAHAGTIENVPEGTNRKVVVSGRDVNNNVIYQGEKSEVTVITGQTTSAGTIVVEPHTPSLNPPSLTTPTNGETLTIGSPTFEWNPVTGASEYVILVSTERNFSSTEINETVTTASYTSNTTLSNGTYYWKVKAKDNEGSESVWSEVWNFTINTTGQNAPVATITSPIDNSTYNEGDTITFSGTGEDAEDGTLSEASLVWTSSIDIQIGIGASFSTSSLSSGMHTITFTATDSDGATGSDSVSITVNITDYINSLGMTFKLIPAGTFTMGSPVSELGRNSDETQHQVTLTQSFYMQTTEVTQAQWTSVMGSNPSNNTGCSDCPVEQVTWDDVQIFITELNTWGEVAYRLPTEAEWEYAARAGSTTAFANGDITVTDCSYDPNLDVMSWYCYNSSSTQSVAQKNPNAWGLYDMYGNVWEWCQDWYGIYPSSSVTNPTGPTSGSGRVVRGGSWYRDAKYCRSAHRTLDPPHYESYFHGFRLVLVLSVPKLPDTGQTQSYTSTFGEDSDYTINPPSYTENGDGTITDNVTSLIWQKEDDDITRNWDDAINCCNDLTLAGYSDWRLPSKKELMSIVDYGTYGPSIDTTYFPGTNTSFYSSSTTHAVYGSPDVWIVNFGYGDVDHRDKSAGYHVRCVRGQELSFGNFTDNGDGTVTNNNTGLMWQQGEGGEKTWEDAISYCEGLSLAEHGDWRLPNIKELESITDVTLYNPTIDTNFFPNVNVSHYWSSTTYANDSPYAWYVYFYGGYVGGYDNKSDSYDVRCVRAGQ